MRKPFQVVDRVYAQLKILVIEYKIPPGSQIHIEDVANSLNVSVTPVREALNRLLNEGYLKRHGGRGFYNRTIDLEELYDLFQLRGSLAISAVHILLRTDLRTKIDALLDESDDSGDPISPWGLKLCERIVLAVGNREMIRLYANISDRIKFIWDIYAQGEKGAAQIASYREDLRRTMLARDISAAAEVIERNIELQTAALSEAMQIALARAHGGGVTQSPRFEPHVGFRLATQVL